MRCGRRRSGIWRGRWGLYLGRKKLFSPHLAPTLGTRAGCCCSPSHISFFFIHSGLKKNSILGACATIGVVSITVGMSVKMLLTHTAATLTATHKLVDWAKLPLALATISFAYGGNVVYPHVEQSMRYPRQWTRALWLALMVCFAMYISIALAGYAAFGHETLSPILRNLPSGIRITYWSFVKSQCRQCPSWTSYANFCFSC